MSIVPGMADGDVQRELGAIEQRPVSEDERKNACRALMRFKGRRGQSNAEEEERATANIKGEFLN